MKKNKKIFFIILPTILVIIFFGVVLAQAVFFAPTDEITIPSSIVPSAGTIQKPLVSLSQDLPIKNTMPTYPATYPKRLRIPTIGVDAKIQYVGIARNGNLATPNNFTDVGWFQNGTVPGDKGSAVIDGHVDNGLAWPAVFANLGNLTIGDDIYIDTIGGDTLHFKVMNTKDYVANATTVEIFSQNDANYLKLITCAGVWSILHRTHDQRLVVTAMVVI